MQQPCQAVSKKFALYTLVHFARPLPPENAWYLSDQNAVLGFIRDFCIISWYWATWYTGLAPILTQINLLTQDKRKDIDVLRSYFEWNMINTIIISVKLSTNCSLTTYKGFIIFQEFSSSNRNFINVSTAGLHLRSLLYLYELTPQKIVHINLT